MLDTQMEGMMKTVIKYAPIAMKNPDNYEARANLMWTSSWAINGYIFGCKKAPWSCHAMEHQLSGFYDITHGEGLAIITPVWMEYILNEKTAPKLAQFARNVFGIQEECDFCASKAGIAALRKFFFETMGIPSTLQAVGITEKTNFEIMAEKLNVSRQTISKWEMDAANPEMDKALELCKVFNCTLDNLFRDEMDKRSDKYTNLRIETVPGFRYVEHTVVSTDPEGDALDRVFKYAKENGYDANDIAEYLSPPNG